TVSSFERLFTFGVIVTACYLWRARCSFTAAESTFSNCGSTPCWGLARTGAVTSSASSAILFTSLDIRLVTTTSIAKKTNTTPIPNTISSKPCVTRLCSDIREAPQYDYSSACRRRSGTKQPAFQHDKPAQVT